MNEILKKVKVLKKSVSMLVKLRLDFEQILMKRIV